MIAKADADLNENKLDDAKKGYEAAITLKAKEQYPKDKLAEIQDLLAIAAKKSRNIQLR